MDEVNLDRNTLKVMVAIFGWQTPVKNDANGGATLRKGSLPASW